MKLYRIIDLAVVNDGKITGVNEHLEGCITQSKEQSIHHEPRWIKLAHREAQVSLFTKFNEIPTKNGGSISQKCWIHLEQNGLRGLLHVSNNIQNSQSRNEMANGLVTLPEGNGQDSPWKDDPWPWPDRARYDGAQKFGLNIDLLKLLWDVRHSREVELQIHEQTNGRMFSANQVYKGILVSGQISSRASIAKNSGSKIFSRGKQDRVATLKDESRNSIKNSQPCDHTLLPNQVQSKKLQRNSKSRGQTKVRKMRERLMPLGGQWLLTIRIKTTALLLLGFISPGITGVKGVDCLTALVPSSTFGAADMTTFHGDAIAYGINIGKKIVNPGGYSDWWENLYPDECGEPVWCKIGKSNYFDKTCDYTKAVTDVSLVNGDQIEIDTDLTLSVEKEMRFCYGCANAAMAANNSPVQEIPWIWVRDWCSGINCIIDPAQDTDSTKAVKLLYSVPYSTNPVYTIIENLKSPDVGYKVWTHELMFPKPNDATSNVGPYPLCMYALDTCTLYYNDCLTLWDQPEQVWIYGKERRFQVDVRQDYMPGYSYDMCIKCKVGAVERATYQFTVELTDGVCASVAYILSSSTFSGLQDQQISYNGDPAVDSDFRYDINQFMPINDDNSSDDDDIQEADQTQEQRDMMRCRLYEKGHCGEKDKEYSNLVANFGETEMIRVLETDYPILQFYQSDPMGYSFTVCLECDICSRSPRYKDNFKVTQVICAGHNIATPLTKQVIQYSPSLSGDKLLDFSSAFSSTSNTYSPVCSISDAGSCGGGLSSSDLSYDATDVSNQFNVLAKQDNAAGYIIYICVTCTFCNEALSNDDWEIMQCRQLVPGVLSEVDINTQTRAKTIDIQADDSFGNADQAVECPITGCTLHDAGNCGGGLTGDAVQYLTMSAQAPFKISVAQSIEGYTLNICVQCSAANHFENIDNFKIVQRSCSTNDLKSRFNSGLKTFELLELQTKHETKIYTPLEILKEIYSNLYASLAEDCIIDSEAVEIISIDSSSSSFALQGGNVVFSKMQPFNFVGSITFKFTEFDFELKMPVKVIVCGFETIVSLNGYTVLEYELNDKDKSLEYFTKYTIGQLLMTSNQECYLDKTSFELVLDKNFAPLSTRQGENYVVIDQVTEQIYIDRATAKVGSFSAFLVAQTVGGVRGGFYEFKIRLTQKLNQAPFFNSFIEDIKFTVHERDQIIEELGKFIFYSPMAKDLEGNVITMKVKGYEAINGTSLTILNDYFKLSIDKEILSSHDTGKYEIDIALTDDGPDPKFANRVSFQIEILFIEMDPQEKADLLERLEYEKTLLESGLSDSEQDEIRQELIEKIKRQKRITERIGGFTFPGVTDNQMVLLGTQQIEDPKIFLSKVNAMGKMSLSFDQPMFFPENIEEFDYGTIINMQLKSGASGKVSRSNKPLQRLLVDYRNCPEKSLNSMSGVEKAVLFSQLDYNDDFSFAVCEDVNKRSWFVESSEEAAETTSQETNPVNELYWKVIEHNATQLTFQLTFSSPEEVSATSLGRDEVTIQFIDLNLFKSQFTGQSVQPSQLSGNPPELKKNLPPIMSNAKLMESIGDSTDMIQSISNFMSSASFGLGLILGGSMQQLYGMIRALQLILLSLLTDISYPAHTYVFLKGAVLFAAMDIFSGEEFYAKHLTFKKTDPINERFDEFGTSDKNFIMNSGSFLIMQILVFAYYLLFKFTRKICIYFARSSMFRVVGRSIDPQDLSIVKKATQKLFLETYFDLVICTFINLQAFIDCESFKEFGEFFGTLADFFCSTLTIVMLIAVFGLPIWIYRLIHKNKLYLKDQDFLEEYNWLFEGLRVDSYSIALYQFYYSVRRLYLAFMLVFLPNRPVLHCWSFIALSLMNLVYLVKHQPFKKSKDTQIEVANEFCILAACVAVFTLLDPATPNATRQTTGWAIIFIISFNVLGNLVLVGQSTMNDLFKFFKELYEEYKVWENRYKIMNNKHMIPEQRAEIKTEYLDHQYCKAWDENRRWLRENGIDFSDFKEESKFNELVNKHQYLEKAKQIQLIIATYNVAEKQKVLKYTSQQNKKKAVRRLYNKEQQKTGKELQVIEELPEETLDEFVVCEGLPEGVQVDINIFQKVQDDVLFKQKKDDVQFENLDFMFGNAQEEQQKVEEKMMAQNQDKWNRYRNEFRKNIGVKILRDRGNNEMVAAVMQCLLPIDAFKRYYLVVEHQKPQLIALQHLLTTIFKHQKILKYDWIDISFFTKKFQKPNSPRDFFQILMSHLEVQQSHMFKGKYREETICECEISEINQERWSCETLEEYIVNIYCPRCKEEKDVVRKQILVKPPSILVMNTQVLEQSVADMYLFATIFVHQGIHLSAVKRDKQWYIFNPKSKEAEPVQQSQVLGIKNVVMCFYQK